MLKHYKKMLKILPHQKQQPVTTPELSTAFRLQQEKFCSKLLENSVKLYENCIKQ